MLQRLIDLCGQHLWSYMWSSTAAEFSFARIPRNLLCIGKPLKLTLIYAILKDVQMMFPMRF